MGNKNRIILLFIVILTAPVIKINPSCDLKFEEKVEFTFHGAAECQETTDYCFSKNARDLAEQRRWCVLRLLL